MTVAAVTNSQAASATATASKQATVSYDGFLKLLVAQAQHQDPTNPTDSTQYLSQLASFSSVEQAIKTNSKLDELLAASSLANAGTLIGLRVTSQDGSTSGTIASVSMQNGTTLATLDDGHTLAIDGTVKVSRA